MVASSQMAPKDSLGYARWLWQGYLELLEDPEGYDELFLMAEAEEWPIFVEALMRLTRENPQAARALVEEVLGHAEGLRALGVRLKSREAFLEQVGLSS